jgi:hypothetical protein
MIRFAACLIVFAAPAVVAAAPAVKGKAVFYHPTKVGDSRTYETSTGDARTEYTEEVTKVEVKDETFLVSTARSNAGKPGLTMTFEVSARGVSRVPASSAAATNPTQILRLPMKEGESWTHELQPPAGAALPAGFVLPKTTYTVVKEEEVVVPAGKFKAIRVEMESSQNGERRSGTTNWYAPGVGLVKTVLNSGTIERTTVLKSFTPGK